MRVVVPQDTATQMESRKKGTTHLGKYISNISNKIAKQPLRCGTITLSKNLTSSLLFAPPAPEHASASGFSFPL